VNKKENESKNEDENENEDEEMSNEEEEGGKEKEENNEEEEKKETKVKKARAKKPLKGGENFCRINLKKGYQPKGRKSTNFKRENTLKRKARYLEFRRDMETDVVKPCGGLGSMGLDGYEVTNEAVKDNSIPSFSRGYDAE
jgi:hypothetical protein